MSEPETRPVDFAGPDPELTLPRWEEHVCPAGHREMRFSTSFRKYCSACGKVLRAAGEKK